MRLQSSGASLLLSAVLPSLASAITLDCAHINVAKNLYDLSGLGGIHQISHAVANETEGYSTNTTYLLNICKPLGKAATTRPEGKCASSKNSMSIGSHDSFPKPLQRRDSLYFFLPNADENLP